VLRNSQDCAKTPRRIRPVEIDEFVEEDLLGEE
jgi:hypothetical protein